MLEVLEVEDALEVLEVVGALEVEEAFEVLQKDHVHRQLPELPGCEDPSESEPTAPEAEHSPAPRLATCPTSRLAAVELPPGSLLPGYCCCLVSVAGVGPDSY